MKLHGVSQCRTPCVGKKLILIQSGSYEKITRTWEDQDPVIQDLIISNIKADLARRIAVHVKLVEQECSDPPEPEDKERYEEELRKELQHSYDRLEFPSHKRRRGVSEIRDSSVELGEPLSPAICLDVVHENDDSGDDSDGIVDGGN